MVDGWIWETENARRLISHIKMTIIGRLWNMYFILPNTVSKQTNFDLVSGYFQLNFKLHKMR